MTTPSPQPPRNSTSEAPPPSDLTHKDSPLRPWRTEGLPKREPAKGRSRWLTIAISLVGYLLLFGILTLQDRLSGPQPVPYTEFKNQVDNKNVSEVFARGDSIEGQLKKAATVPGQQDRTYQQFTTERPTFANR
jgi:cell division protease FtsH